MLQADKSNAVAEGPALIPRGKAAATEDAAEAVRVVGHRATKQSHHVVGQDRLQACWTAGAEESAWTEKYENPLHKGVTHTHRAQAHPRVHASLFIPHGQVRRHHPCGQHY